jgi:hypothetical protein
MGYSWRYHGIYWGLMEYSWGLILLGSAVPGVDMIIDHISYLVIVIVIGYRHRCYIPTYGG